MEPCILRLLKASLLNQMALADVLANPGLVDPARSHRLLAEAKQNLAEFDRLIAKYQIQIEPR